MRRKSVDKPGPGYDLKELDAGCEVEREHTKDRFKACRIAVEHLREDPRYYTKLCRVWPGEPGCQHVKSSWPDGMTVLMLSGLALAGYVVIRER